ncbi:MAG: MBL fold metallo-hydrolase [Candidatus Hodarchaeales archaeon]|jgi:glyoxylase-like metal-dependent hydrolase (beta-lactamase superfamily II)
MKIIKVSESVYFIQDSNYYLVNSICVSLGSELLFIDTGFSPEVAKKFRNKMHEHFKLDKAVLTITHANNDHFMGLEAFLDIPIIVSEKFLDPFNYRVKNHQLEGLDSFIPTQTFSSSYTFGYEENHLTIELVGGHTDDSCFGYFPAEKILIAGDNLMSNMPQFLLHPDSNLEKLINCLKRWEKMEISTVVPGHGNPVKKDHIRKVRAYYEELYEYLVQAKEANLTMNEILKQFPEYFEPDPENWIKTGIQQVFKNI